MTTADSFDENGQPLFQQETVTICPAAHVDRGREIALHYFQKVCGRSGMTVASMFTKGIAPNGETAPTHYVCPRRVYQADIDRQSATQQQFAANGDTFVAGDAVQAEDPAALTSFCLVLADLETFLALHGMQEVSG